MFNFSRLAGLLIVLMTWIPTQVIGQDSYQAATIAFYNVENLFDTLVSVDFIDGTRSYDDPNYHVAISVDEIPKYAKDTVRLRGAYNYENITGKKIIRPLILQEEDFSPKGKKSWTGDKYYKKLSQLSKVIVELGSEVTQTAPVIVGLCEVETKEVVEDLANEPLLRPYDYGVIHFNSFDARGIDVALMYQKSRFQVTLAKPYPVEIRNMSGRKIYTRDILRVTGLLDGEEITFLVNHWPSRAGGEKRSQPNRMRAAKVMKEIFDEIRAENPKAKIIAMGDFNDDPVSPSIKEGMGTVNKKSKVKDGDIYNLMDPLFKAGRGTLAYRDAWNLFDQFIVTGTLIEHNKTYESYKVHKTEIFDPPRLRTPEGPWKGYPYRMYGGDTFYPEGTSDHFPVYTVLLRRAK